MLIARRSLKLILSSAAAGLALQVGFGQAAAAAESLLQPTPLILKDGRIASVSVHVLPFEADGSALAGETSAELRSLTREVATDCFLTAQVIGHVGQREVESKDTLAAHRLARARADTVQASLIDSGLPAKSIASVWDWQFMVLEARATLWVFRLTEGEDCEGKPLEGMAPLLAEAEQPAEPRGAASTSASSAPSEPTGAGTSRAADPRPEPPSAASGQAAPAPEPAAPARVEVEPPTEPAVRSEPAAPPRAPIRTEPLPAIAAREPARAERPTAERPAERAVAAAQPANQRQAAVAQGGGDLTITFATNSSYFPPGTGAQLKKIIDALAPGGRYQVDIVTSVATGDVVGATSPEEAARYNRWLADRRLDRVREWFAANAPEHDMVIAPTFKPNDNSRQITVSVAPAGNG